MRLLVLAVIAAALSACGAFKYDPYSCGQAREGGGPTVYATRGQELCEASRRAVHQHYVGLEELPPRKETEDTYAKVEKLRRAKTVEDLLAGLRDALGDRVADDVANAIEWARTKSTKTLDPDPAKAERQLIRGASKGIELAMEQRFIYLGPEDDLSD